jgi:hypothetical protein
MASEIQHEPASARKPMGLNEGTDAISGILNREAPADEAPQEATPEAKEVEPTETEEITESAEESPAKESAEKAKPKEAKEKPAKEEDEVTSEIELEPAQVAQLLGLDDNDVDVDDDGHITIHAKIDGKPATVPLADLRRNYELAQTHEQRLRDLGRERKAFEEESRSVLENLSNQHQQFSQAVQALEDDYASEFKSVDWTTLRTEDPTEYSSKRLDYEDRRRRIEEYKAQASRQSEELRRQYTQHLQKKQSEGAKYLDEVFGGSEYKAAPKWDQAEKDRLSKWIMDRGFTAQDISSVAVAEVFKWARDSMLREQELKQARETVKKVSRLPRVVKPGKPKSPKETARSQVKELKARQIKSKGGLRETTDLIGSLLDRGN